MADLATAVHVIPVAPSLADHRLTGRSRRVGASVFVLAVLSALGYIGVHVAKDLGNVSVSGIGPYLLLGIALLIALGFEFVNGFHDTANAVATVIYTNSLPPHIAVVWSGLCNLTGVLLSSGTVAFAIIALLPVELILKISSGVGFSMIFALLVAAILWNLGTWWFGLPASSSHTLVGSIIGVGLVYHLLNPGATASGVDWDQVIKVLKVLLISPLLGFTLAGLLIFAAKRLVKVPSLYQEPKKNQPPPWPIRALLLLTCSGVSFSHGSNDGQKGMGLIMLILIGTVPTAYALNHAVGPAEIQSFLAASAQVEGVLDKYVVPGSKPTADPRSELTASLRTGQIHPGTLPALRELVAETSQEVTAYKTLKSVPAQDQAKLRNDMYVASETLGLLAKKNYPAITPAESAVLKGYRSKLDKTTKYIPGWVMVAVALALGLGTMVGWKRIVVTVGERIGKQHLSYAQGASAELVAMGTIFAANLWGLPVSTTHILSSGVAGTMAANGSGLHLSTVRNIAAGWVFTLPAAALLSGSLYLLFHTIS